MAVNPSLPYARLNRDACLDWLQMLSGAVLVLFMLCHMLLVSSVIISPKLMNAIAWFFEVTYMAQIGGPLIVIIFIGHFMLAAALNRAARFMIDPRDERSEKEYYDIIGCDFGIFGCMGLLACEDVCTKHLPLQNQLGFLRRKLGLVALKQVFRLG